MRLRPDRPQETICDYFLEGRSIRDAYGGPEQFYGSSCSVQEPQKTKTVTKEVLLEKSGKWPRAAA
jgi:hypothetical protein